MNTYQNPIIPGFYPDPSICRVEEDYYLVNSSFEFFPGVPLWHSKDLIHWEQIGNVLTRESQLSLADCHTSGGIFAPTLRFHEGRFYMVTTNVSHGGNFYVWTDDIHGSWSDPIYVEQGGIDPSLFWDDDGTAYFISNQNNAAGKPIISQCLIDLATGKKLSPTKPLWGGTGGKCPEGPHMYKINGWYYLMIAEGGTEYGHMQTISRSRSPWGPFESCPRNPILSHRDISPADNAFQALGHSDLVEDPTGQWWIVFHAIRPTQFMLHHIGRETMLAPLTWDQDGWPLVNGGAPITNPMHAPQELTHLPAVPFVEQFASPTLNPGWCFLRCPDKDCYSLSENPGSLTLKGSAATLDDLGSPTFLG
ncbi:MAG: family 43 glycosylhydrolase, partial [Oscillospiraceae bacterium]